MRRRTILIAIASVLVAVLAATGGALGWWAWRNLTWVTRIDDRIQDAGFTEHEATVNSLRLTYGENPAAAGKPVLVLLHGQGGAWESYHPVLAGLDEHFHVYAVDVPGHGGSNRWRDHYTAVELGDLMADFIREVPGEAAYVSGHSSGGHIAATLAARHPDLVRGVLFEDPPFYSTELPRAKETWNWHDLATSTHNYIEAGEPGDWESYYWRNQRMWMFFGDGAQNIIDAGLRYKRDHPEKPITVWFMPGSMAAYAEYSRSYDPYFGLAFYDGSWNDGFDQDATLAAIEAPVVYVHAHEVLGDDGILQAAASAEEARRAMSNMPEATYVEAQTSHNYHGDKPKEFVELMVGLL